MRSAECPRSAHLTDNNIVSAKVALGLIEVFKRVLVEPIAIRLLAANNPDQRKYDDCPAAVKRERSRLHLCGFMGDIDHRRPA
jgi:CRISPR/Cas system-associated endonuclease Cas1